MSDLSAAFKELLAAFDRLEIPFLIGDSAASDIDVVADIALGIEGKFCAMLAATFYGRCR
jgi:hypothetical protein